MGNFFSDLFGGSSKSSSKSSAQYQYGLPPATTFQQYAEPALYNLFTGYSSPPPTKPAPVKMVNYFGRKGPSPKDMIRYSKEKAAYDKALADWQAKNQGATGGYDPQGQLGLAGQTTNLMNQLLGYGMNVTPEQKALLEGQTSEYMSGLGNYLQNWQKGAMSQATQSGLSRGLGQSDIARGMESNVYGQGQNLLAQGYNQAKMTELANKLNMPQQNLQLMANLQSMYNQPFMSALLGSGTQRQPVQTGQTGQSTTTETSTPSPFAAISALAPVFLGALAPMFAPAALGATAALTPSNTVVFH